MAGAQTGEPPERRAHADAHKREEQQDDEVPAAAGSASRHQWLDRCGRWGAH